jgi:hypothetical protein
MCIRSRVGKEVDVSVREVLSLQSGQQIDDETSLRGLFSRRCSTTRRCTTPAGLSIALWYWYWFANQRRGAVLDRHAALQDRNPLARSISKSDGGSNRELISHAASVTSGVGTSRLLLTVIAPSAALGIENEKVAPGPLFSVAHKRPL